MERVLSSILYLIVIARSFDIIQNFTVMLFSFSVMKDSHGHDFIHIAILGSVKSCGKVALCCQCGGKINSLACEIY